MANVMVTLQKLANENTEKTFKYNAKEAATARDWQTEMSNTSHQREVKDLVAAGLNPVLSSGGSGAQSYTTSAASGVADSAVNAIGNVSAARSAAAATRYAAQQNAAAIRASAAMQYAAAKYQSDMNYKTQKYTVDNSRTGTVAGTVGSYLSKIGQNNPTLKKDVTNNLKSLVSNPFKYFQGLSNKHDASLKSMAQANLSAAGRVKMNSVLSRLNIPLTSYYRNVALKAFLLNQGAAMAILKSASAYYKTRNTSWSLR